jgi:hypothetical protein
MTLRNARAVALAALLAALSSPVAAQTAHLAEFPLAVGAGGSFVNDTGQSTNVKAFSNGGFHAFAEVVLETGVLFQVRYETFLLPGTASGTPFQPKVSAPHVRVDAGNVSVGYVLRETWWEAGLFGGVGLYGLSPRAPEAGQVATDVSETVIGWHGGLLAVFQLARRLDLRVEAAGYLLRSDAPHKPILVGGSLAYHF